MLDAGVIAHVGVVTPDGPIVIPMALRPRREPRSTSTGPPGQRHAPGRRRRRGVRHRHPRGRPRALARSAFHHSVNYRSVVVRGPARSADRSRRATGGAGGASFSSTWPRAGAPRPARAVGLGAAVHPAVVLAVALDEASAKVRTGPPDRRAGGPRPPPLGWGGPDHDDVRGAGRRLGPAVRHPPPPGHRGARRASRPRSRSGLTAMGAITVAELWRYPVESMQGEQVTAAGVTAAGLVGDRRVGFARPRHRPHAHRPPGPRAAVRAGCADGGRGRPRRAARRHRRRRRHRAVGLARSRRDAAPGGQDVAGTFENPPRCRGRGRVGVDHMDRTDRHFHDSGRTRVSLVGAATLGPWDRRRFRATSSWPGPARARRATVPVGSTVIIGKVPHSRPSSRSTAA